MFDQNIRTQNFTGLGLLLLGIVGYIQKATTNIQYIYICIYAFIYVYIHFQEKGKTFNGIERRWKGSRENKRAKGGGRRTQRDRPIEAKDLVWAMVVLRRGIKMSWGWEKRRGRREEADIGGRMWSQRYFRSRTEKGSYTYRPALIIHTPLSPTPEI